MAPSEPRGVDRLSRLAPELLLRIFALAHAKTKPTAPLSRSLRPFYDAVKFDKIVARGEERIRALLETITARPAFGSAVRNLYLLDDNRDTQLGAADFQALFALLPELRVVSISVFKSSCLEAVLPTCQGAKTALGQFVKMLSISCSAPDGSGYDAKVLATLKRLPNLRSILLDFPSSTPDQAGPATANIVLPNIEYLLLGLHDRSSTVKDFIACFPRVRILHLRARGPTCDFSPALAGVKSCTRIHQLWLDARPPPEWRFPTEIAEFSALKTLSLKGNFGRVSPEAYSALRSVPITTMRIDKGCDTSAAGLETLLGPRGSCPTLKVLQLDNLSGAYPPNFSREDFQDGDFNLYDYANNSFDAESFLYKFEIPTWTTHFSESAYDQLVRTAKSHGVVVKGSTVTAREIDLVWKDLEDVVNDMRREEEQDEADIAYGHGGYRDFPGSRWNPRLRSYSGYDDAEEEDRDFY